MINPQDSDRFSRQGYLQPAPEGIDAVYAWGIPGGNGASIGFVDIERGWTLNHKDLAAASIGIISGINQDHFGHGTSVLGMLVAGGDDSGCVGMVPRATARVVSQFQPGGLNIAKAILSAIGVMQAGDILLLEIQTQMDGVERLPIEVEPACFEAIRLGVSLGIVIIEAAGNGALNLDIYRDNSRGYILNRSSPDFQDSGAIMVGAANSAFPHARHNDTNYGSRIDCYGWGENITTTGDGKNGNLTDSYTDNFGGTSGASSMIAGAAIAIQGIFSVKNGLRLGPQRIRGILSDPALGTRSADPRTDQIGVMPDLRRIIDNVLKDTSLANPKPSEGLA